MQLVEKHVINQTDARFVLIDRASFASKNLYNAALYEIRQHFIFTGAYLNYNVMDKIMQKHEAYRALPTKVSQQVLKLLDKNWKAFFAAQQAYKEDPSKFKRTRRIDHHMHTVSRRVIDLLVAEGIGTLVIGNNPGWKQEANLGKKNTQHFVQLPHARFIDQLTYKAQLVGIKVILQEESYTSKASFLDLDPLPVFGNVEKPVFSGKRVTRGLYKAKCGRTFNADVNGSYNILRKALPDAFSNGIKDVKKTLVTLPASLVVHPVRIVIPLRTQKSRKR